MGARGPQPSLSVHGHTESTPGGTCTGGRGTSHGPDSCNRARHDGTSDACHEGDGDRDATAGEGGGGGGDSAGPCAGGVDDDGEANADGGAGGSAGWGTSEGGHIVDVVDVVGSGHGTGADGEGAWAGRDAHGAADGAQARAQGSRATSLSFGGGQRTHGAVESAKASSRGDLTAHRPFGGIFPPGWAGSCALGCTCLRLEENCSASLLRSAWAGRSSSRRGSSS